MSFEEQERVYLDLLFDAAFRRRFVANREQALAAYTLSADERADFQRVRSDALELDARMRCDLILQHMCRALPVTFSIVSSMSGGLDQARSLVDVSFVRTPPSERAVHLGRGVRAWLTTCKLPTDLEQAAAVALCDAELSMAVTASALRNSLADHAPTSGGPSTRSSTWSEQPIVLAPHVAVALLSQSYTALKRALCPVADAELWARLCSAGLPAARRSQTLAHQSPRLLVTRAHVVHSSSAEVTVNHRMLELSPGFAPLLSHLDGKISLAELLGELRKAGAQEAVCNGVRGGFEKLLDEGMLRPVTAP